MAIRYKEILGFPEYHMGSDGTVWSRNRKRSWKQLRGSIAGRDLGHLKITLVKRGRLFHRYIHRLVLETFVGKCPRGMETCHRNDDGFDNRLCNLRWGTRSENRIEGFNNNVNPRGENHYAARLTEHKAKEALKMIKAGQSVPEIAQCLGVTRATIYPLKKGRTWKHLSDNQGALR